jgi:hypothetical protein
VPPAAAPRAVDAEPLFSPGTMRKSEGIASMMGHSTTPGTINLFAVRWRGHVDAVDFCSSRPRVHSSLPHCPLLRAHRCGATTTVVQAADALFQLGGFHRAPQQQQKRGWPVVARRRLSVRAEPPAAAAPTASPHRGAVHCHCWRVLT